MSELRFESLPAMLTEAPELRPQILRDCVEVLDGEVARKRGASGLIIKGGFKIVKKLKGGRMVEDLIGWLLEEFMRSLDPFYQEYRAMDAASRGSFSDFIIDDSENVAEALLSVTDQRRERATTKVLIKTYDRLRPTAIKHVEEGIPAIGRMVQKYIVLE